MKFTENAFRNWGYALASEFPEQTYSWMCCSARRPRKGGLLMLNSRAVMLASGRVLIKDAIADITLQQVLHPAQELTVIATRT